MAREEALDARANLADLEECARLAPREEKFWHLRKKDYSIREIAQLTGVAEGTVKAVLHEVRRKLKVARQAG